MERYEEKLAAAYVRGLGRQNPALLPPALLETPLEGLSQDEMEAIVHAGEDAGLRMYHFKKKELLPRVKAVLGFLYGVQPESLLDVGSGRGVFLFPFLSQFPWAQVTAADILPHRVQMLQAIADGGIENLTVLERDICHWPQEENRFDVVTLLEVLEHIPKVDCFDSFDYLYEKRRHRWFFLVGNSKMTRVVYADEQEKIHVTEDVANIETKCWNILKDLPFWNQESCTGEEQNR